MVFLLFLSPLSFPYFFAGSSSAKNEEAAEEVAQRVRRRREESRRTKHLGRHACEGHVGAVQGDEVF